ncbi:DNA-binding protein [Shewanella youngdeokensis]|uniref:DNA-binding protein n=1 Tax=Shewanella youngdeokensis TaxID=2999068 RepID=A0ABZ0JYK7_9GAMM|nr:DNA-binding protein [Shewanella sp. DAU334]
MKSWLICIDDTDDIGTKGTGEIAEEIAALLAEKHANNAECDDKCFITRHQLFVHPSIPYTSHNSAMCFLFKTHLSFSEIKQTCVSHLLKESAGAADPGLAILDMASTYNMAALIAFGQSAKVEVKTKQQAYDLAKEQGVDLTEHGGTGQGVIGALAGIGLRLSGQDGRVKGHFNLCDDADDEPARINLSVDEIIDRTSLHAVMSVDGAVLAGHERVILSGKIKAVYCQHRFALLVNRHNERWVNASKQLLKSY